MQPLVLIPSRYQSSRFPGKPLALINEKPMIQHVYQNLESVKWQTFVVTDHDEIEKCVKSFGGKVLRVDDDVLSGSDRIFLAYDRFFKAQNTDFIINVQGDEPLISHKHIDKLISLHRDSDFDICTLYKNSKDFKEFKNENRVKIAMNFQSNQCLYFSRSAIPNNRSKSLDSWTQHLGVYSYTPNSLEKFYSIKKSHLESVEQLEQLKALELGMTIGATEIKEMLCGVDTPEDIKKVEEIMDINYE